MVVFPAAIPFTWAVSAVLFTEAIELFAVLQVPAPAAIVNVVAPPTHADAVPVIAGLAVTT